MTHSNAPLTDHLILRGTVVHERLAPRRHRLAYRVLSTVVNVDRLADLDGRCRFLSYNRPNLFSIYDADHGDGRTSIAEHARSVLTAAGLPTSSRTIHLLSYPRLLGYAFNPLAVYFVRDAAGTLETLIYQVHNTFGERRTYVVPAGTMTNGVYAHGCSKELFVSPFAEGRGTYSFRVRDGASSNVDTVVAVLLKSATGPVLRAHFRSTSQVEITDQALLRAAAAMPLATLKVTAGIHWEALKLWLKGVPLTRRHRSPKFAASRAANGSGSPQTMWRTREPNIALTLHQPPTPPAAMTARHN